MILSNLWIKNQTEIPSFIGDLRNLKFEHSKNGDSKMKTLGPEWTNKTFVNEFYFGQRGGRIVANKHGINFDITIHIIFS